MSQAIHERLNQIPDKILSTEFLLNQGLGNEIGFWIFDYAPEDELKVREYIHFLEKMLLKKHNTIKFLHLNLLNIFKECLVDNGILEEAFEMQKTRGDAYLLEALEGLTHVDEFAPYFVDKYVRKEQDFILMTGVGSIWPFIRAHNLLNKLHALLGNKPLVLFYPGHYDGQSMSLFGKIPSNNYYRAFRLVP